MAGSTTASRGGEPECNGIRECVGAFVLSACAFTGGCSERVQLPGILPGGSSWHAKVGWKAEEYFDDPQVVALCRAIEANDLDEIDRLVAAGADVNARGKGNMTPLLWAFPDNKLERFERLLEHGADPNVVTESDFGNRSAFHSGDTVTHMAARTAFPGYFQCVMEHGGDPNVVDKHRGATPIHTVIKTAVRDRKERIQLLIDKGADLDHVSNLGSTPVREAVKWFGQYDVALLLLESGADASVYKEGQNSKLVHVVVREESRLPYCTPQQRSDYENLVKWLDDHGESIDDARRDVERWKELGRSHPPAKLKVLREKEIAERLAREKAEAEEEADED